MARGFLAEMQHQAKVAARDRERAAKESERIRQAAIREAERTRKAEERAAAQLARANEAEAKRLQKEAKEAHVAAMEAEVERLNLDLAQKNEEIDSLLAATLEVDDYVDLDALRTVAEHPPFDGGDFAHPIPPPTPRIDPPEPVLEDPSMPKKLSKLLGQKIHTAVNAKTVAEHEQKVIAWKNQLTKNQTEREAAALSHAESEANRIHQLEVLRGHYMAEREQREADVAEQNSAIDKLIVDLSYGDVDAVHEYISIVLSNSVYPSHFEVGFEFKFDAPTAELRLRVIMPGPDDLPTVGMYKYKKTTDEITETALTQKACKDRYAGAANEIALRSLHEVFEADRRGIIKTISLEVGAETIDPATGLEKFILFIATGAERESFLELDLSKVVPAATLEHLGASVSKNPFGLVATKATGVRNS